MTDMLNQYFFLPNLAKTKTEDGFLKLMHTEKKAGKINTWTKCRKLN